MSKYKTKKHEPAPSPHLPPSVRKVTHKTVNGGDDYEVTARWWLQPEEDIYKHVSAVVETIENRQATRRMTNSLWFRIYNSYTVTGYLGGVLSRMMPSSNQTRDFRFTLNVVESCIESAAAKIAKSTPLPKFLTNKGSFMQQKKAKLLNRYVEGMFNQLNVFEVAQQCFIDSCIWGTSGLKVFIEDGQIKLKRVLIDDIIVDDEDGRDGDPQQLHQRGHMNRDVLCELYPEHEAKIRAASAIFPGEKYTPVSQDLVAVTESWRRPSIKGADDGLHTICIDNCTLSSERWDRDWFPIVFLRWQPRPVGFFGKGIAEQLAPIQFEINKICRLIQESITRMAKPNIFVSNNSGIVAEQISDLIGSIIRTNGGTPTVMVPQAQSPEVYQWLENLYKKAYEITGLSQASAQSAKPAEISSGAALREYQDIESARFALQGQRFENFFCDLTRMLISFSRELFTENKKLHVKSPGKKFIETIDWKDVNLEDDEFIIDIFPESSLPTTPRGRLQTISELTQAGYISKERSLELLDFPDLEEFVSVQLAALEDAKMMVDAIRWEGKYTTPTPLMDLKTCIDLAHSAWLNSQQMDTPQEHQDMLVNFMNECQYWLDNPPAGSGNNPANVQPGGAGPEGGPGGAPPLEPGSPPPPGAAPLPGRADGGPVAAGQDVIVGERGPEIVHFNQPGTVVPNEMLGDARNRPMVQAPKPTRHAPSHAESDESLGEWARKHLLPRGRHTTDGSWMSEDEIALRQYVNELGQAYAKEHPEQQGVPQGYVDHVTQVIQNFRKKIEANPAANEGYQYVPKMGTAEEEKALGKKYVPQFIQDAVAKRKNEVQAAYDARNAPKVVDLGDIDAPSQPTAGQVMSVQPVQSVQMPPGVMQGPMPLDYRSVPMTRPVQGPPAPDYRSVPEVTGGQAGEYRPMTEQEALDAERAQMQSDERLQGLVPVSRAAPALLK